MFNIPEQRDLDRMVGSSRAIKDLISFPRSPLDLPFHVVTARVEESYEDGLSESVARCVASGVSDCHPQVAAAAAIGEAWERIAFVQQHDRLVDGPVSRSAAVCGADTLFELPFLLDKGVNRIEWAKAASSGPAAMLEYTEWLPGGKTVPCELPAFVALPGAESSLFETTNGMACGNSFEEATDRAVRELVERDALMLVWLAQCPGTRVAPERFLEPRHCAQIARLQAMGIQVRLRDISTDLGVSVFLAEIFSPFPAARMGLAFGAGAHVRPHLAARHAFREAGLSWRGISWRALTGDRPVRRNVTPASFAAHAEYYSSWDKMHLLDFLLADDAVEVSDEQAPAGASTEDCGTAHIDLLLQQGRRVLAVDITPEQAAGTGLVVVQAVVPGLVPLYIGESCADDLASRRFPTRLGKCTLPEIPPFTQNVHPWP